MMLHDKRVEDCVPVLTCGIFGMWAERCRDMIARDEVAGLAVDHDRICRNEAAPIEFLKREIILLERDRRQRVTERSIPRMTALPNALALLAMAIGHEHPFIAEPLSDLATRVGLEVAWLPIGKALHISIAEMV